MHFMPLFILRKFSINWSLASSSYPSHMKNSLKEHLLNFLKNCLLASQSLRNKIVAAHPFDIASAVPSLSFHFARWALCGSQSTPFLARSTVLRTSLSEKKCVFSANNVTCRQQNWLFSRRFDQRWSQIIRSHEEWWFVPYSNEFQVAITLNDYFHTDFRQVPFSGVESETYAGVRCKLFIFTVWITIEKINSRFRTRVLALFSLRSIISLSSSLAWVNFNSKIAFQEKFKI